MADLKMADIKSRSLRSASDLEISKQQVIKFVMFNVHYMIF
jgi:hypothetical protein